ncbi:A-kinase anchor protein 13 isoform X4 [Erinaceus europaeus]|uniref:A-kinase anchor protein 13 isoform X4 n=1 Tax=Erinaceus europaeus TaxID=9365 RepID=A0ABM3WFK8_ERIEU|nr:A-kinase anchor protein 13 isoform X4 [Erinaceus europaeus]
MKLNPQQAPLYGDCVVTVLLAEEDKVEDDVVFYLVFSGSTLRHCASTRKVSSDTLETIAPGHDCCETVKVLLCASKEGLPVFVVAEEDFRFIQDEAYDAARFLATSAGDQLALNFTRFLDRSGPLSRDVDSLDEKVALAFRHLKLPTEWNVLGTEQALQDSVPRETLLHFAVRLGLLRLAWFLLQKPGGRGALNIHNQEGATPASLALERGYHQLHQLLTQEDAREPDSWSSLSYEIPYGDYSVRHHRELGVYTLTSEAESQHGAPADGDSRTGHISKLMNIQQQLMKTHIKQMDPLLPPVVTAQEPSGPPSTPDTLNQCLPYTPEPITSEQPPPPRQTEASPGCLGSPAKQNGGACGPSSMVQEENKDCSRRKKKKGTERKIGEATAPAPAPTVIPAVKSDPNLRAKCPGGLPSCGVRKEGAAAESSAVTKESGLGSHGHATSQRDMVLGQGSSQPSSTEERGLGSCSAAGSGVSEMAGDTRHGLRNPGATPQAAELRVGDSAEEKFENPHVSTATEAEATSEPAEQAQASNSESATSSLGGTKPAESSLALSSREASMGTAVDKETCSSCQERTVADRNSLDEPAVADKVAEGPGPSTPSRGLFETLPASDLTLPRPGKDVGTPHQNPEVNSSQVPICPTAEDETLWATPVCQQNTVTATAVSAAKHPHDTVPQPENTPPGQPDSQHSSTASNPPGQEVSSASTPASKRAPQEGVDCGPLQHSSKKDPGKTSKPESISTDLPEGAPYPHANIPREEEELGPRQPVTSDRTFSLAASAGCESVTEHDALAPVPSQKEKGTAALQLHTAADHRDGPDRDPSPLTQRPPGDEGAVGLSAFPASPLPQPSMGNTSTSELGAEQEGPCLSAAPECLNLEGATDTSPQPSVCEAPESILTEAGETPVVPESCAAQEPGEKAKAVTCPFSQKDTPSSEALLEEQRTPVWLEATGFCGEPSSVLCAEDKACHSNPPGAPSACLLTETKHNQEVAPPVSQSTEGGAAQSLVPPGAGLAADSSQEVGDAEPSSSPLLPDGAEAPPGVRAAQQLGESPACRVSRNVLAVTEANPMQAGTEARRADAPHSSPDTLVATGSLGQEAVSPGLPGASVDTGQTDLQGAVATGEAPLGGEKRKEVGASISCHMDVSKEEDGQTDDGRQCAHLQPNLGLSGPGDKVPSKDSLATPSPHTVSADSIEEAASRIVDAVLQRVKAQGVPPTPPSSPVELHPLMEPQEEVRARATSLPEETLQVDRQEDAPGKLSGEAAEREEPETFAASLSLTQSATEMPGSKADDEVDFLSHFRANSVSEEVAGGSPATPPELKPGPKTQAMNRESWCTVEPCPDAASLLTSTKSPGCENFLDDGLNRQCASKQGALKRESGSDSDLFQSPSEDVDSITFSKPEEEPLACDTMGSSSSTDDTASLDRHSSQGSDVSLPQVAHLNRSRDQQSLDGFSGPGPGVEGRESENEAAGSGDVDEEEMDSITEVPASCSVLRSTMRSLSPFRRHSWGPGKNAASDTEMNPRSSMPLVGDVIRRPPIHRRSMSWCPSGVQFSAALNADFNCRSFSLEGLTGGAGVGSKSSSPLDGNSANTKELGPPFRGEVRGGSLVSLSEEDLESGQREHRRMFDQQTCHRSKQQGFNYCTAAVSSPLTKSISLMTISHPALDNSRPFHSTGANLTESITEENYNFLPQSPSKKDFEGKSGTKVSRTFSYIKNKMSSSKKSREKEKEKDRIKEKEKDSKEKEKDKKTVNGHSFSSIPTVGPISCGQCLKPFTNKDAYSCANCGAFVHKGCRENLASCAKVKMKQPKGSLQAHDTSSLPTVIMRNKPAQPKERPRSAVLLAEETTATPLFANRRSQQSMLLSKSVSIQNIAGVGNDENMSNTWKFLSHSTDSLNKISKVNESTESLTDEGTDMNEGQLMGDFELEAKQFEAESWSRIVDSKFLKQQKKEAVKRQEVIYELMQTELHHIRTLKIMSDVYSRGMMTELLFEQQTVEKLFPCLDELISIHSQFFQRILERKKESLVDKSEKNFLIKRMGDVLVNQFSGENAERLKKTYGKFCGQHNQSVNYFKDLHTKDKRFQAFVKKKMSSSVVRRLGIPECILLVTQRITKYPVLFQRMLQCTKDNEAEQEDLAQSLSLVKDVIGAVDSKVASYEKKVRLNEIYMKTDSKSIMRMKSGQMFAKEDLKRKKLVRDGSVFLKNAAGRLKEVQAVLLRDILVFLQEKDQKYIFASLDQKSTVISLKKLIVREVAHEEKGLFLISMGVKDPEMVEVHASSREERNGWIQSIQDTINALNRDEDEGIPSENEEEKKMLDTKARELKEQLQQKDQQILHLLEEKETIFRDMTECSTPLPEDCSPTHGSRVLFRSNTEEALKGAPLMKSAINEVEILQGLVSGSLGGSTLGQAVSSMLEQEGVVGPVSLPRRAETFGGFDSHQMNASKGGEKEEGEDAQDLRRTESDSGLKKGGNANLVFMLKRNSEQVIQSVVHLHELLSSLQGVVLQQDSYIEDQKLLLSERALSRSASRPSSLIEQEKQRSLEKQRQDLANLQRQQAQQQEEQRRRERQWEARERALQEREARLAQREDDVRRGQCELERELEELQQRKGTYQGDLERLRAAQRQLEREQEQLRRDTERLGHRHDAHQVSHSHTKLLRIPSFLPNPEEPQIAPTPSISKSTSLDSELSVSPKRNSLSRTHKDKGPFHILSSTSQPNRAPDSQAPTPAPARLFGLAKPKEKKDKEKEKKKKSKGSRAQPGDGPMAEVSAEGEEIFC